MKKITPFVITPFALALASFLWAIPAFAATQVYFSVPSAAVAQDSVFHVAVLIDADRISNAYSATIAWSGPIQLISTNDAQSIITLWQKKPVADADNTLHFEGGALAPFAGTGGRLLILDFKAVASGTAKFSVIDAGVYLADGAGTKITPAQKTASIAIAGTAAGSSSTASSSAAAANAGGDAAAVDTVPPEIQFIEIVNDPSVSGKKLLSFLVADAGSGVQASQVRYRTTVFWSGWQEVSNPASLPDNAWAVEFRTTDNAGNTAAQTIYDWPALWILCGEAAIVVILLTAAGFALMKKKHF